MRSELLAWACIFASCCGLAYAQNVPQPQRFSSLIISEEQSKGIEWTDVQQRDAHELRVSAPARLKAASAAPSAGDDKLRSALRVPSTSEARSVDEPAVLPPFKFIGKLFFRVGDGDYVCAGSLVAKGIVLTPAHCVQDRDSGIYHSNLLFALFDQEGKELSRHNVRCIGVFNAWTMPDEDLAYASDYAMILLRRPPSAGSLGLWVPAQGELEDTSVLGRDKDGRPAMLPAKIEPFPFGELGIMRASGAKDLALVASGGGPWIYNPSEELGGDTNLIVGITSFASDDDESSVYSPSMDWLPDLYHYVSNGCE